MGAESNLGHLPDFYGHGQTVRENRPIWPDNTPVPWMTYPAISYLNQFDFSKRNVFEYGCGQSTLYWAGRSGRVISVEHDRAWFEKVRSQAPSSAEIFHAENRPYVETVRYKAPHDVIV